MAIFESFLKQDKRIVALDVPRQEVMTKDNISVNVSLNIGINPGINTANLTNKK